MMDGTQGWSQQQADGKENANPDFLISVMNPVGRFLSKRQNLIDGRLEELLSVEAYLQQPVA